MKMKKYRVEHNFICGSKMYCRAMSTGSYVEANTSQEAINKAMEITVRMVNKLLRPVYWAELDHDSEEIFIWDEHNNIYGVLTFFDAYEITN